MVAIGKGFIGKTTGFHLNVFKINAPLVMDLYSHMLLAEDKGAGVHFTSFLMESLVGMVSAVLLELSSNC